MTKLNQLLAELCPQGVPFLGLDEIVEISTGVQLNKNDLDLDGPYAYYNGGSSPSGSHSEFNTAAGTAIVSQGGASAGFVNYVDEPFWAGAHCYVLQPKTEIDSRFLYFSLKAAQSKIQAAKVGAGIPGLNRSALKAISIQVPPLPVQLEIVRILNEFTLLEAELEAELEARKKQYEHYRNELLSFKHLSQGGVRWVTLSELGEFYSGLSGKSKEHFEDGNQTFASYMDVFSNSQLPAELNAKVVIAPGERQNQIRLGDIIFTGSSESLAECALTSVVTMEPIETTFLNSFCFGLRGALGKGLRPDFARFLFRSADVRSQILKCCNGVTRVNVSKSKLGKVMIPVPSESVQREIARQLDHFDKLANDISEGLPAEINARRKQYEYYREQLLTFNELVEA